MTEEEKDHIVGTIVLAKMEGATFKLMGSPVKGQRNKLNMSLVLMQDKQKIWEAVLFKDINRVADLTKLDQPDLNSTMGAASEYLRRAVAGDEDVYLKGRLT